MTLQAQNLSHLIDDTHTVTNPEMDASQIKWLYKVFQDIMLAPTATTIVTKHLATKDTRAVWKELCQYFDNSMNALLRCQAILRYMTSTQFHSLN